MNVPDGCSFPTNVCSVPTNRLNRVLLFLKGKEVLNPSESRNSSLLQNVVVVQTIGI